MFKGRLYFRKGPYCKVFVQVVCIVKFVQNCEIRSKLYNLVQIVRFGQNCQIRSTLWNFIKFLKFVRTCQILYGLVWPCMVWSKFWSCMLVQGGYLCVQGGCSELCAALCSEWCAALCSESCAAFGLVWCGLVEIVKLNSRPWMNQWLNEFAM